jgi:hypothetical protein
MNPFNVFFCQKFDILKPRWLLTLGELHALSMSSWVSGMRQATIFTLNPFKASEHASGYRAQARAAS